MKNFKNISALVLLATAFTFGACTQDETMDDVIDNAEINSPAPIDPIDEDVPDHEDKP